MSGFDPPWQCPICTLPNNSWEFHGDTGEAIFGSCGCHVLAIELLQTRLELPAGMIPMLTAWATRRS